MFAANVAAAMKGFKLLLKQDGLEPTGIVTVEPFESTLGMGMNCKVDQDKQQ
jgi:hypothetical protein